VIIKTTTGHRDPALCCGNCGNDNVWQPADMDPCTDDWWCGQCSTWSEPDACHEFALMILKGGRLVPVCHNETPPSYQRRAA